MPCRSDKEFAQGPDEPNAVTPPRRRTNDGAGRDKSDVEISDENDEHEVANPEKTKRVRELLSWTTVKTWVTGERAQFEDADIQYQLEIAAREIMNESGIVKLPGHKDNKTDLGMFKKNQSHTNHWGIKHVVYRCCLRWRTRCQMAIRVVTGPDYIELQRSGTHHHVQVTDKKKLTIEQALAVQEAARSAPGVSAAQLRRNLRTHDSPTKNIGPEHARQIQRLVYQERKKVQQKMLGGAVVDDNFGSMTTFCER